MLNSDIAYATLSSRGAQRRGDLNMLLFIMRLLHHFVPRNDTATSTCSSSRLIE